MAAARGRSHAASANYRKLKYATLSVPGRAVLTITQCDGKVGQDGIPCSRCLHIAADKGLAVRFCGYDLVASTIRHGIIGKLTEYYLNISVSSLTWCFLDFYSLSERGLVNISVTTDQPTRSIMLTHPLQKLGDSVISYRDAPTLELVCHEYDGAADIGWVGPQQVQEIYQHLSNLLVSELTIPEQLQPVLRTVLELVASRGQSSKSYIFLKNSLPDKEKLVQWGNFDITMLHKIAPGDVETALTAFLTAYVERKGMDAPHVRFCHQTSRSVLLTDSKARLGQNDCRTCQSQPHV